MAQREGSRNRSEVHEDSRIVLHAHKTRQKKISTLNDKLIANILNKTGIKMNYSEVRIKRGIDDFKEIHNDISTE